MPLGIQNERELLAARASIRLWAEKYKVSFNEDPLSAARGIFWGILLSVAFFWLPLAWWVFG